jgi:NIMA-interacting peptidyl-prolyl cis-trans isomerase 1
MVDRNLTQVGAKHILLKHIGSRNPNDSYRRRPVTRSFDEAMSGIQQVQKRLSGGQRFEDIAGELSECGSAARGGDLGIFGRGDMQKQFEDGAFSLKVGEISGPIVSDSGIHLILRYQ